MQKLLTANGKKKKAREKFNEFSIPTEGSIEECWESLKKSILDLRNEFVPKRTVGKRHWKGEYPSDAETFKLLKLKDKAYRKWLHHLYTELEPNFRKEYNKARNKGKL